jgi:hypothetical protein
VVGSEKVRWRVPGGGDRCPLPAHVRARQGKLKRVKWRLDWLIHLAYQVGYGGFFLGACHVSRPLVFSSLLAFIPLMISRPRRQVLESRRALFTQSPRRVIFSETRAKCVIQEVLFSPPQDLLLACAKCTTTPPWESLISPCGCHRARCPFLPAP